MMTSENDSTISPIISSMYADQQSGSADRRRGEVTLGDIQVREDATVQPDRRSVMGPNQPCSQAHLDCLASWLRSQGIEPTEPKDELARIIKIHRTLPEGLKPSMMVNPK